MALNNNRALQIRVIGIVQGVGFRPFVYKLAVEFGLLGVVYNEGSDVIIILQGSDEKLSEFLYKLESNPPTLSRIKSIKKEYINHESFNDFRITESRSDRRENVYISPDTSICADCEKELMDKSDRRYMYPFINCTNCGPRFTIVKGIPYDRPLTTMAKFPMCSDCHDEYTNPLNRRYHAQPTCCSVCGPDLMLADSKKDILFSANDVWGRSQKISFRDILVKTIQLIKDGKILAVKGIGGYHLVCDAENDQAVKLLRKRKHRDDKPFAVMMKDIATVKYYCEVNSEEERLLTGEKKPIVLLKKKPSCEKELSRDICGNNPFIGVMLPYTPVHFLIFNAEEELKVIVATSGNISSEPIAFVEDEAFQKLQGIADYYLINNRDIFIRTDDSVTRVFDKREYLIRRSRGYAPTPVFVQTSKNNIRVLATGGELKSTFCISNGREFYLSHHIGDLENAETLSSFEEGIEHYKRIFQVEPEILAYDMHPEYLSTKYALKSNIPIKIPVQHHQAHIAACMADNDLEGQVIGVAFDGTGFGTDGRIWGGEFFAGGYAGFKRFAHLDYVKLPGGEKAVKEPWRMAAAYLKSVGRISDDYFTDRAPDFEVSENEMLFLLKMMQKGINSPLTSSAGRLFDAASAILGIRSKINYEGQAAIELEHRADVTYDKPFNYDIVKDTAGGGFIIKQQQILLDMASEKESGAGTAALSGRFHHTVATMICDTCKKIKMETDLNRIVLSGGVFQNITLLRLSLKYLRENGFEVFIHERIPANDGGISLGQAVMAGFMYKKD